ncbi:MAG: hypothetical protein IT371_13490 [Deltaproteobacteria bacterium]|nr:hypothetical protein [Deltaproteobacteria bacterium]
MERPDGGRRPGRGRVGGCHAALLCLALAAAACSTRLPLIPDGSGADAASRDGTAADGAGLDGPRRDQQFGDGASTDAHRRDLGPLRDAHAPGDLRPAPDIVAGTDGPASRTCTQDSDCKVFQDCCTCQGVLLWENPGLCKRVCKQNACAAWGMTKPQAYCLLGRCHVAEVGTPACAGPKDCRVIDDCCHCLAAPARVTPPVCQAGPCLINKCAGMGLPLPGADCIKGGCRLTHP